MMSSTAKPTDQRTCSFMDTIGQMVLKVFNSLNDNDGTNGKKLSTTPFCKAISSKCTDNNKLDDPKIFRQFKISNDTIQNLEEFEAIHETQIRFQFQNRFNHGSYALVQLNPLEQSCLETLGQILDPLRYSWSATSNKHAQLKQYIENSLNRMGEDVRPPQKTIISACESGINLLIQLTKQIDTFACLTSNDQMLLLQHSIMSIMTLRSILLSDRNEPFPSTCHQQSSASHNSDCKRKCSFLSDSSSDEDDDDRNSHSPKPSKTLLKRMCLDAFCPNPHDYHDSSTTTTMQCNGILDGFMGKDHGKTSTPPPPPPPQPSLLSSLLSSSPSSSSAASTVAAATTGKPITIPNHAQTAQINVPNEKTITIPETEMSNHKALEYEMKFVENYQTLLRTIDPCWSRDKYIFYLLFVIALFQTNHYCSGNIENIAKVRRFYFTYVYLLKRYLQQKFHHQTNNRSVARSHYIRLIDLIQQVQSMNRNIIQKILGFRISDAHNLLEKLCGC